MNFEEIKNNLANDVKEIFEAKTGKEFDVEPRTVEKMNETYEALTKDYCDTVKASGRNLLGKGVIGAERAAFIAATAVTDVAGSFFSDQVIL